jgi:hypothetical protein
MDELKREEARLSEQGDRLDEHIEEAKDAAERARERHEFPAGIENDPESGPEEGAGPNPAEQGSDS